MKRIFFSLLFLGLLLSNCSDDVKDTAVPKHVPPIDWSKYDTIPPDQVNEMAAHYLEWIKKNPDLIFQQVNMDGEMLESMMYGVERLKLIPAANAATNNITMIMQFLIKDVYTYYDIHDFFNSSQPGMRGQEPLCPPPQGCEIILSKSDFPLLISEIETIEMADLYKRIVKKEPTKAILQITMDGLMLDLLTIGTKGLKLICAASTRDSVATVITQFWKNDNFYYINNRDIYLEEMRGMRGNKPLCPPPECGDLP